MDDQEIEMPTRALDILGNGGFVDNLSEDQAEALYTVLKKHLTK